MNSIIFLSILTSFSSFFNSTSAQFSHDVTCIIDKGQEPICKMDQKQNSTRRFLPNTNMPLYMPYIPRTNAIFYNCSTFSCNKIYLQSITELTNSKNNIRYCYRNVGQDYQCEDTNFMRYKNIDKLLFLKINIKDKLHYFIDCLLYNDNNRICIKKTSSDVYEKLLATGHLVRPHEQNVLLQEEFICEESETGTVYCDLNKFIPFPSGLKLKETADILGNVLLKTNLNFMQLEHRCFNSWCGYIGQKRLNRRYMKDYEGDAGKNYKCYSANGQQICKEIHGHNQEYYNERAWLSD